MEKRDCEVSMKVKYTGYDERFLKKGNIYKIINIEVNPGMVELGYLESNMLVDYALVKNLKPVDSKVRRLPRNMSEKILFKLKNYLTNIKRYVTILIEQEKGGNKNE